MGVKKIQASDVVPRPLSSKSLAGTKGTFLASSLVSSSAKGACYQVANVVLFIPNMIFTLIRKAISWLTFGLFCGDRQVDPKEVRQALKKIVQAKDKDEAKQGFKNFEKKHAAELRRLIDQKAVRNAEQVHGEGPGAASYKASQVKRMEQAVRDGDSQLAHSFLNDLANG